MILISVPCNVDTPKNNLSLVTARDTDKLASVIKFEQTGAVEVTVLGVLV